MKNLFKIIVILFLFLVQTETISAQPEWDDDPIDTPIDGGLSLLIVSAIGFGLHSLNKIKKDQFH